LNFDGPDMKGFHHKMSDRRCLILKTEIPTMSKIRRYSCTTVPIQKIF